jgi:hypothetical protein
MDRSVMVNTPILHIVAHRVADVALPGNILVRLHLSPNLHLHQFQFQPRKLLWVHAAVGRAVMVNVITWENDDWRLDTVELLQLIVGV